MPYKDPERARAASRRWRLSPAGRQWRAGQRETERALERGRYTTEKRREKRRRTAPEKLIEYGRRWRVKYPEKRRAGEQRRRAMVVGASGRFTAEDWQTLIARSRHCHWCKQPFTKKRRPDGTLGPPTHDHVVPLSKGGANSLANSVCAHLRCNISKHARSFNPITGQGILI
jgi:5-methylcytosine-specific restriction endonuclease McrA